MGSGLDERQSAEGAQVHTLRRRGYLHRRWRGAMRNESTSNRRQRGSMKASSHSALNLGELNTRHHDRLPDDESSRHQRLSHWKEATCFLWNFLTLRKQTSCELQEAAYTLNLGACALCELGSSPERREGTRQRKPDEERCRRFERRCRPFAVLPAPVVERSQAPHGTGGRGRGRSVHAIETG